MPTSLEYRTIISPAELKTRLAQPNWRVIDCRFSLADTDAGRHAYRTSHIPGAVYAHLDSDLSGPVIAGTTGRHPLPSPETFAARLSSWGVGQDVQVVAYDDKGGAIASRLWWMLKWMGHEAVAVLDGGWPAWVEEGFPVESVAVMPAPRRFVPNVRGELAVDGAFVAESIETGRCTLVDARAAERYRGEHEPIDPVAGHIPTAINRPFSENLNPETGRFNPPDLLRERFRDLGEIIVYCGSGVTAAHDILATQIAGLPMPRLYAGSWSDWITRPSKR
ncbi:MAG: sulfurtransferase [Bacteroidota bacterium]